MPNRRPRHAQERARTGLACYVELLHRIERITGSRKAAPKWVREWLLTHPANYRSIIPANAPFTLITGIRLLFETPWMAIASVVGKASGRKLDVIICVGDADPSRVIIVDAESQKIVIDGYQESAKLRFKDVASLRQWMGEMAEGLAIAVKEKK